MRIFRTEKCHDRREKRDEKQQIKKFPFFSGFKFLSLPERNARLLISAFLWFLLSFSFWGIGKLLANNFGPPSMREDYPETSYFFLGLSVTGLFSGLWWLFFPVNYHFATLVNGIGIGYGLACLPAFPDINFKKPWFLIASGIFLFALLMKSAGPTGFYDCGLYYVQTIRWAQQFPAVPGLANLHIRFGNASLWHIFSAAYDIPGLWKGNFDSLGELMLFWFLSFHAWQFFSLEGFERWLSFGLMLAATLFTLPLPGSPNPDLACGVLGMHTLWQFRKFLRYWDPLRPNQLNTRGLTLFIQSFFLAGIKLSALPFLLIAAVVCFLVVREGWFRQTGKLLFLGLAAFAAMFLRSYILTGWLFFPVWKGTVQPDWQVETPVVKEYLDGVKGFARHIPSHDEAAAGLSYPAIAGQSLAEWLPVWASERSAADWIFIMGGVSGWLFLFWYAGNKVRKNFRGQWPLVFFTWLSGMMMLFWFVNAPDPRFGLATLGSGFSYLIASLMIRAEYFLPSVRKITLPALIIFSLSVLYLYRDAQTLKNHVWVPAKYMKPGVESYPVSRGVSAFAPSLKQESPWLDSEMCWDAPLPCSINPVSGLRLRGTGLRQGFYLEKKNAKP